MGFEPIDAEYESQMEAVYNGVLEEYFASESYAEDVNKAIEEFSTDRQKSFYIENPTLAEPAFALLKEAQELFDHSHYAAAQVLAGAAAEVTFGDALLKPMLYGCVHNDTLAPVVADIVENARQFYRFKALLVAIVSEFSGISLTSPVQGSRRSLWDSVDNVRKQRNEVLHGDGLLKVTREDAEEALTLATTLIETVFPSVLTKIGLHLHHARVCGDLKCATAPTPSGASAALIGSAPS